MPALSKGKLDQARSARTQYRARREKLLADEARREMFEERAAIIEFCANVSRATAERWALECLRRVKGNA